MPSILAHDLARTGASTIAPTGPSSIRPVLRAARDLDHRLSTPWTAFPSRLEATVPRTAHATSAVFDAARMAFGVLIRTVVVQSAPSGSLEPPVPTFLHQRAAPSTLLRTRHGSGTPEEIQ